MGDPLYLQDPERPDERDRIVRGIEKTIAAPLPATRYQLVPGANYVYDPVGGFWLPQEQAAGVVIALFKQIASYTEDSAESSAQIRQEVYNTRLRIAGMLAQMPDYRGLLHEVISALGDQTDATETGLGALVSGLLRGGTPERLAGAMAPPITARAEQDVMRAWGTRQGTKYLHDLGWLEGGVARKWVGTDAGAYVSPVAADGTAVSFTGVNLSGRVSYIFDVTDRTVHVVTAVVDPVPPTAGTLTVAPPLRSANAVLRIPYRDVPHGYSTPTEAIRTEPVTASPPAVNGPAPLLANAALVESGTPLPTSYSLPAFVANYDLYTVWIFWAGAGDDTYQWDIRARIDDQAAGDWIVANTWFNVIGSALGVAAVNGLTGVRVSTRTKLREIDVYRTKTQVGDVSDAVSVRVWIELGR